MRLHFYYSDKDEEEKKLFDFIKKQLKAVAKQEGLSIDDSVPEELNQLDTHNSDSNCIVIPFCTKNMDSFIGLEKVLGYRTKNYKTPFLFIIYSKHCLPDFMNPHKVEIQFVKDLLGNPSFGDANKAVLMAESFIDTDNNELKNFILLSLTDNNFFQSFVHKLKWIEKYNNDEVGKIRERFYHTFIDYYDYTVDGSPTKQKIEDLTVGDLSKLKDQESNGDAGESSIQKFTSEIKENDSNQLLKNEKNKIRDVLELTDYIHCLLNGLPIPKKKGTHNIPLELFRAPVPFPLQELVDARDEISKELKKGGMDKKIKLLLIDNRSDNKFIAKDVPKPESLCDLFFSEDDGFGLGDFFEIQMLGKSVYKKKDKDNTPQFYQNDNDAKLSNSDFKGQYEEFKFKKFKNKKALEKCEKEYHETFINKQNKSGIKNYADFVYHKVKDADFVLLDFFLDNDDTYLAFDFIRDMADIKRKRGDVSTTWYFITSAVYDSVMKYSQSGLLAEYYESAVVNAGDDPTNEKRQIIFIYKLLTFIQARLRSFESFKKAFYKSRLFKEDCGEKTDYCKDLHNCLYPIQALCRKYLGEYNEIINIFPSIKQQKTFKEKVELTDNIINQFLWLPEADWPMIQRQIEHLNIRLEKEASDNPDGTKLEFCCNYILEELKKRSKIY